jgi:MFS family permease
MGLYGFIWATAGAVGPILGGVFTQFLSWRFIFWISLPVCGLAFVLLFFFLDVHNPRTPLAVGMKAVDWFGTVSTLGLTIMLLLGLVFGGATFPWKSPTVIGLIVAGCYMGGFFFWSEKRLAKYPLMPLALFKEKSNIACLLVAFFQDFVWVPLLFKLISRVSRLPLMKLRSGSQLNTTFHFISNPPSSLRP